jgi:hypothetical protein
LIVGIMSEVVDVAQAHGIDLRQSDIDEHVAWTERASGMRTSTMVDRERGRTMEADALIGVDRAQGTRRWRRDTGQRRDACADEGDRRSRLNARALFDQPDRHRKCACGAGPAFGLMTPLTCVMNPYTGYHRGGR